MISNIDRYFIERKYHNPDEEFNAFARMTYHGTGYIEDSGLDDEGILNGLKELYEDIKDLPHPVSRAKAIKYVLENERVYINEHDYFVGLYSLNRLANSVTFNTWEAESHKLRNSELLQQCKDFHEAFAIMYWVDYDHVVPDWQSLMELGFVGIVKRAEEYRQLHITNGSYTDTVKDYFDAINIQYNAIIDLIDRMQKIAEKQTFPKAKQISVCLRHLKEGKPTDFYEALQMIYLYFIISESIDSFQVRSLGNGLDNTLLPFYLNDVNSGKYSKEQISEFLEYFLLQWSSIGNYWGQPFYMGGTDENGNTRYNELSHLILEVYDNLEIYNPKIQLKINENTPDSILEKAFSMVQKKNASIVFCCEPAMIKAIMGYGATYEEALNYDIRGCYETGVRANEVSSTAGYINAAKAVEYVFTNGYDAFINKQVGLKSGELSSMFTFDDFYFAFLRQWEYLIEQSIKITNDAEKYISFVNPSSMYSATIKTSLKNGKDGYGGGVKFNNNAMLNCSFASAVDSIMAVKEFVFDKKEISLTELKTVLQQNWQGYEILRLKIMKSPHKYGNNDKIADLYAQAMSRFFANKVNNVPNARGGVYKAIFHSARAFIEQGKATFALPNGRLKGEELSKNASPSPGMDKNGVTALVESAVKLSPSDYHESFCLDVMLHPSVTKGEEGINAFKSILFTYLKKGGQSIQFNIFNPQTLIDAQLNPEKYKNMQVRVCGWNTLWNNMSKKEQDAYILRARNIQ